MNNRINCIILDDEPLAVKLVSDYASKLPHLQVLYAGSDVYKAMEVLKTEAIDIVFIDIQMPQLTGIQVMQLFDRKHNFIIISAYSEYALDAFRFHVVDFVLKPVTFDRFYQSIEKFVRWQESFQTAATQDFLLVKADRKHYHIPVDAIVYIESMKDYIRIHTDTEKIMVLENMKDILEQLPSNRFFRIHRSYIIPKSRIKIIEGNQVQLINGHFLPIGETYRKQVNEWVSSKSK